MLSLCAPSSVAATTKLMGHDRQLPPLSTLPELLPPERPTSHPATPDNGSHGRQPSPKRKLSTDTSDSEDQGPNPAKRTMNDRNSNVPSPSPSTTYGIRLPPIRTMPEASGGGYTTPISSARPVDEDYRREAFSRYQGNYAKASPLQPPRELGATLGTPSLSNDLAKYRMSNFASLHTADGPFSAARPMDSSPTRDPPFAHSAGYATTLPHHFHSHPSQSSEMFPTAYGPPLLRSTSDDAAREPSSYPRQQETYSSRSDRYDNANPMDEQRSRPSLDHAMPLRSNSDPTAHSREHHQSQPSSATARSRAGSPHYNTETPSHYTWEVAGTSEQVGRRRRGNLPKESTAILNEWFTNHINYPYPKEEEKQELQTRTGLTMAQISNWFINARRRRRPATAGQDEDQIEAAE